jgi:diaminobutyrate-2-oxoglutarate transaminase
MTRTAKTYDAKIFEENEANVRSYCRSFPTVFKSARGATLTDVEGREYVDFLAGAGVMNYGHNNPAIKSKVVEYMLGDGLVHSLDMYTQAKHDFIETLYDVILEPRGLDYKVTFPGPTGTNAVETALKFARNATGRQGVVAFTNAFHGMTLGALALTGNRSSRAAAGVGLAGVTRLPFDGYMGEGVDTAAYLDKMLSDRSSGLDLPAAIIVETVQSEGGVNVASFEWLRNVSQVARKHGVLFIVDDIQTGCGRMGTFFSFEGAGFTPDIVCLSKALGGMGLPMSLVLFRPDLDVLSPGAHNGTFRGHNLAFVAAKAALDLWRDPQLAETIRANAETVRARLEEIVAKFPMHDAHVRGRGLMRGISWSDASIAGRVSKAAFKRGLVIETCGAESQVLKLLPPLIISQAELAKGLDALEAAVGEIVREIEYLDAA